MSDDEPHIFRIKVMTWRKADLMEYAESKGIDVKWSWTKEEIIGVLLLTDKGFGTRTWGENEAFNYGYELEVIKGHCKLCNMDFKWGHNVYRSIYLEAHELQHITGIRYRVFVNGVEGRHLRFPPSTSRLLANNMLLEDRYQTSASIPYRKLSDNTTWKHYQEWLNGVEKTCKCCNKVFTKQMEDSLWGNWSYLFCQTCWRKWRGLGATCHICKYESIGDRIMYRVNEENQSRGNRTLSTDVWTCGRCHNKMKKYNLSPEQFLVLRSEKTCNVCGISVSHDAAEGKTRCSAVIDHDHDINMVRGILCLFCNVSEGQVKQTGLSLKEWANNMQDYLDNPLNLNDCTEVKT